MEKEATIEKTTDKKYKKLKKRIVQLEEQNTCLLKNQFELHQEQRSFRENMNSELSYAAMMFVCVFAWIAYTVYREFSVNS